MLLEESKRGFDSLQPHVFFKKKKPSWVLFPPQDLPLLIGPLTPPPTFAVTPPGWRAWVLAHPRNLVTRSATDGIYD